MVEVDVEADEIVVGRIVVVLCEERAVLQEHIVDRIGSRTVAVRICSVVVVVEHATKRQLLVFAKAELSFEQAGSQFFAGFLDGHAVAVLVIVGVVTADGRNNPDGIDAGGTGQHFGEAGSIATPGSAAEDALVLAIQNDIIDAEGAEIDAACKASAAFGRHSAARHVDFR